MTERWNNQRPDGTGPPQSRDAEPQFGWNPEEDTGRFSVPQTSSSNPPHIDGQQTSPAGNSARASRSDTDELPDPAVIKAEIGPVQESTGSAENYSWPGAGRSGGDPFYRRLPHLAIIGIAIAMVLGGGFWHQDYSAVLPGGTDSIRTVSGTLSADPFEQQLQQQPSGGNRGLVASTAEDVFDGYLSVGSLSVTTQQITIDTYVTDEGETIQTVAEITGRSPETLLWANDLRDARKQLPGGSQVRVPPEDGMLHVVRDGDTLDNIAERYDVTQDAITGYEPNGVEHSADLVPNRLIMVPGGSMPARDEVIFYTVREGDQLWQIADRYGLRAETLLWANSLPNSEMIRPGQQLAIPPTDGILVTVDDDDTVVELAETYGVDPSAIRAWPANALGEDGRLMPGQSLMIPGGSPPAPPEPQQDPEPAPVIAEEPDPPAQPAQAEPPPTPAPDPTPTPQPATRGTGSFVWPTTGVITQYFHAAHNGWDIANRPYTEVWAADTGTVTFSGWNNYGLGYSVAIDHGNGYVTWYGHLAEQPPVRVGQSVSRGQYIGPMGSTGFSTGPHVHFVIAYNGVYQDPGNYLR